MNVSRALRDVRGFEVAVDVTQVTRLLAPNDQGLVGLLLLDGRIVRVRGSMPEVAATLSQRARAVRSDKPTTRLPVAAAGRGDTPAPRARVTHPSPPFGEVAPSVPLRRPSSVRPPAPGPTEVVRVSASPAE